MKLFFLLLVSSIGFSSIGASAQVNNICTDSTAEQALLGLYDPASYVASVLYNTPDTISRGISSRVSADSLQSYIRALATFRTRNSGSDTLSATNGIGSARRWVYNKFQQFSAANENRLLPAYLQFDTMMCGVPQHRNIFAVLPGLDTSDKSIVIIEGHIDSRCAGLCDISCNAQGIEDNASGTALVLELARVMSAYSYNHTIVFLITVGEEQGLYGGYAFANYAKAHNIPIKAVMNNDIIGGIICGHTSSAPGCPGYENIDSSHVRLFSQGGFNSFHKGLCRYIKLEYKERVMPTVHVSMGINIMTPEDRLNRSGDHIPFRQLNYTAMRFTSQNEAGDASVSSGTYTDRQHTSSDSIGIDINHDGVIDTYWVNFNYLARNAVINGNAAGMIAISPPSPDFTLTGEPGYMVISITKHPEFLNYKVGVRTTTNDWDTVYTFTGDSVAALEVPPATYIVSVASVDASGVESLFSKELTATVLTTNGIRAPAGSTPEVHLLQNKPNPSDEATMISVLVTDNIIYKDAYISIRDMAGREVSQIKISLAKGVNEIIYQHGYDMVGTYLYTLIIDGKQIESKRMVFTK
jgi:Peptidase family M28